MRVTMPQSLLRRQRERALPVLPPLMPPGLPAPLMRTTLPGTVPRPLQPRLNGWPPRLLMQRK
jgi:hypothetical protein